VVDCSTVLVLVPPSIWSALDTPPMRWVVKVLHGVLHTQFTESTENVQTDFHFENCVPKSFVLWRGVIVGDFTGLTSPRD